MGNLGNEFWQKMTLSIPNEHFWGGAGFPAGFLGPQRKFKECQTMWCMNDWGPLRGQHILLYWENSVGWKIARTALSYSILAGCHAYSCWVPVAPKVI